MLCPVLEQTCELNSGRVICIQTDHVSDMWQLIKPQIQISWSVVADKWAEPWTVTVGQWLRVYAATRGIKRSDVKKRITYFCQYFLLDEKHPVKNLTDKQLYYLSFAMALLVQPKVVVLQYSAVLSSEDCSRCARLIQKLRPAMAWLLISPEPHWLPGLSIDQIIGGES